MQSPGTKYRFDHVEFDPSNLQLTVGGETRALEPKSYRLLAFLVENNGQVVSKDEILRVVWEETAVTDNALTRAIAQIRKALDDDPKQPRFIETVPTVGYRFIGNLVETAPPIPPNEPISTRRWPIVVGAGIVVVICAGVWLATRSSAPPPKVAAIRQVTRSAGADTGPSFSPDASQIAFSSNRSGHYEVYVRSLAPDGEDRQLTSDGRDNLQPAWSPDGRYLAYANLHGIKMVPVSGGPARYLSESGDSPQWSPDGKSLVVRDRAVSGIQNPTFETTGDRGAILDLLDVGGGPARALTSTDKPPFNPSFPHWLPDGRHILFAAGQPDSRDMSLWVMDVTSREARQVHTGKFPLTAALSPDGRYLYYTDLSASIPGIWRARTGQNRAVGKSEPMIPMGDSVPRDLTMSSDGRHLAFTRQSGESAIWSLALNANGTAAGEPKPLIRDRVFRNIDAVISADGSKIAWASLPNDGNDVIYIANSDGSARAALTPAGQRSMRPQWVGKELKLAYEVRRGDRRSYWIAPLEGKAEEVHPALDLARCDRLRLSPDGSMLAAQIVTPAGLQVVVGGVRGGSVRLLTPSPRNIGYPIWSPDGQWIAAEEKVGNRTTLVAFPSGGGAIRTVASELPLYFPYDWSPDSRRILFAGLQNRVWNVYWIPFPEGKVEQLTHFTTQSAFVRYTSWSPKGDQVVFEHNDLTANIYVADLKP